MKPAKGIEDLASRLITASTTPLVQTPTQIAPAQPTSDLPTMPAVQHENIKVAKKTSERTKTKEIIDTMPLTLRPTRALHARYISAAIKRSQKLGRVVSAQEIMLEVLEKGEV